MFRIFTLIDEIYVYDSFLSNKFSVIYPMLVKMSWSIKQTIFFSSYQRRVKRYSMPFSKIQTPELKTSWIYIQMASIVLYACDWQIHMTWNFPFRSHSNFNAQLSWRKTFATFLTSFSLEPLRMLKILVRHLSLIVSSTAFCVIQPSFWTLSLSMR